MNKSVYLILALLLTACKPVPPPAADAVVDLRTADLGRTRASVLASAGKHGRLVTSSLTTGAEDRFEAEIAVRSSDAAALLGELAGAGKVEMEKTTLPQDPEAQVKVIVRAFGPGTAEGFRIPAFRDAFIGVANAILGLLYIAVWLSPLILGFIVYRIVRKRRPPSQPGSGPGTAPANQTGPVSV